MTIETPEEMAERMFSMATHHDVVRAYAEHAIRVDREHLRAALLEAAQLAEDREDWRRAALGCGPEDALRAFAARLGGDEDDERDPVNGQLVAAHVGGLRAKVEAVRDAAGEADLAAERLGHHNANPDCAEDALRSFAARLLPTDRPDGEESESADVLGPEGAA